MTHAKSILQLKRKALAMGLCGDYKTKWDNATTHKHLADLALDINGADFLCASVAKKWGLTKDFLLNNFNNLINGKYTAKCGANNNTYTSEIYIGHNGNITAHTTILIVLYSNVTIHVPTNHICRIFSAGNTNISVESDGTCELIDYTPQNNTKHTTPHLTITDPHQDPDSWINFNSRQ